MSIFGSIKNKPEMLSANDLLEIFPISRSGIYDLLREPGFPCIHLGRRIIVPRDAMIEWLENRLQEELNSAAKSREANEVSAVPEAVSEADTDLPETQVREDGVYIKVLSHGAKKPQAI